LKKTNICVPLVPILVLLLASYSISSSSTFSSVILPSTGSISSGMPGPTYSILQTGTVTRVVSEPSGTIVYYNANANLAFGAAFGYVASGGNIRVQAGTYTANDSSITMLNCNNVYVTFQPNAILTITDWANTAVFRMENDANCIISGIGIDGNAANQLSSSTIGGVIMVDCSNCLVTGANITNCRASGFLTGDNHAGHQPNGIINSIVTFAGWNGISLGWGGTDTIGAFAKNNTVAYCSDVGITGYGVRCVIIGNYIHDMNGTTGDGGNAHYGIAVEENGYDIIANNTIENCVGAAWHGVGIITNTGAMTTSNLIIYNNITNCNGGISLSGDNDVVMYNTVTEWGAVGGSGGINFWSSAEDGICSFNTLKSINDVYDAIMISGAGNCTVSNNKITMNTAYTISGVLICNSAHENLVRYNNIQARTGITIQSGCSSNKLDQNTLTNCTTRISDSGTGTIINPTYSATYKLTFANVYDGSAHGTYIYPNSTQVSITLSSGGVLNVDGLNVTLAGNAYTLSMNQDHYAYALGTTTINSGG